MQKNDVESMPSDVRAMRYKEIVYKQSRYDIEQLRCEITSDQAKIFSDVVSGGYTVINRPLDDGEMKKRV